MLILNNAVFTILILYSYYTPAINLQEKYYKNNIRRVIKKQKVPVILLEGLPSIRKLSSLGFGN